jgi:PAS domain S-box-containing protein
MCNLHNFAPLEFTNKDGFTSGISIDIIRLIEKKLNYKILIQNVKTSSDTQTLEYFKNKKCDILPVTLPQTHAKKHKYTNSYLNYEAVVITRTEEPFIRTIDDIKYKGVAYKNVPSIIDNLKRTYPGINIIKTNSYKESFEKVSSGEVYSTMSILPIASYNISKFGYSNLKIAGHSKDNIKFSMAINTEDNYLVSILNKALDSISQKEHSDIFNKWVNIKYDKNINYSKILNIVLIGLFIIILLVYRQYMLSKTNEKLQKAKNKLEESNNRIIDILESTVESIIISKDGVIVECNKMAIDMYGHSKKDMIGMSIFDLIHDESHNSVKLKQKSKRTKPYEINIVNNEGAIVPALVRGSDIIINGEKHRVSICLDLTELKKTQEALENLNKDLALKVIDEVEKNKKKDLKLLHQARHAQMGELINMIAHQWRQPLNAIAATIMNIQLQLSLDKFDLKDKKEQDKFTSFINIKLENMETFIQTLSVTIDDFRNFYKQDNETKEESVHIPIKKALNIVKALIISKKIEITQEFNSIKKIEIFESELLQVFLNIVKNAQDNFEDRQIANPTIVISTKDTNTGVVIEIQDNGEGVPLDVIDRIFDPYFSTKDIKNGTGLGLYMSKSIIEKHHKGKFYAHNKNNGVCFTIELHDNIGSAN